MKRYISLFILVTLVALTSCGRSAEQENFEQLIADEGKLALTQLLGFELDLPASGSVLPESERAATLFLEQTSADAATASILPQFEAEGFSVSATKGPETDGNLPFIGDAPLSYICEKGGTRFNLVFQTENNSNLISSIGIFREQ